MNESDHDVPLVTYDSNSLLDVGNRRGFLLAGDLVELRYLSPFLPQFMYTDMDLGLSSGNHKSLQSLCAN